jgi:SAM-dependent methyltransferase
MRAGVLRFWELGCGAGQDARFLTELGFAVIAADFSQRCS